MCIYERCNFLISSVEKTRESYACLEDEEGRRSGEERRREERPSILSRWPRAIVISLRTMYSLLFIRAVPLAFALPLPPRRDIEALGDSRLLYGALLSCCYSRALSYFFLSYACCKHTRWRVMPTNKRKRRKMRKRERARVRDA